MTPADIAAMKADALAGTPGDWLVSDMFSVVSETSHYVANAGFGADSENGNNIAEANARRIARVPRMENTIIALTGTNVAQAAEIERLTAALLRYGEHSPSCDLGKPCQCGFFNTLEGTPK